jgi:hypothetical protein
MAEYEGAERQMLKDIAHDLVDELNEQCPSPNFAVDCMAYALASFASGVRADGLTTEEIIHAIAMQAINNLKGQQ